METMLDAGFVSVGEKEAEDFELEGQVKDAV